MSIAGKRMIKMSKKRSRLFKGRFKPLQEKETKLRLILSLIELGKASTHTHPRIKYEIAVVVRAEKKTGSTLTFLSEGIGCNKPKFKRRKERKKKRRI